MPHSVNPSLVNELKEKYLELSELEEEWEDVIQIESQVSTKFPRRVKDIPKTLHYAETVSLKELPW